ncbi:hypothetical protein MKX01_022395 [Papaver californicum]|nr:hypothetical protein MKX01_022395 [Papaver californicum]
MHCWPIKENISFGGVYSAEVLLGRDTRPSVVKNSLSNLVIQVRNSVGADVVQKEKIVPSGFGQLDVGKRCASLDGDADRLVYFHVLPGSNNKIELVDGDKILLPPFLEKLSFFALFNKQQLTILKQGRWPSCTPWHFLDSLCEWAYTDYLKKLGLEVALTPTGVKYLHEKAYEYDIGIYFEANGHGTILFSASFLFWLETRNKELASTSEGLEHQLSVKRLLAVSELINQAVGVILPHMGWSIQRWSELYEDLPSRKIKVKVMDRTAVITANTETEVEEKALLLPAPLWTPFGYNRMTKQVE